MPNWCNNTVYLTGPTKKILPIYEQSKEGNFLNALMPMPEDLDITAGYLGDEDKQKELEAKQQANIKKHGSKDWYDWRTSNWGTKWDIDGEGLEYTDHGDGTSVISGWFDSAWSPPEGAYETFLADNEDCELEAYFYEGGCDFAGKFGDSTVNPSDHKADDFLEADRASLLGQLDEEFGIGEQMKELEDEEELSTWMREGAESRKQQKEIS